MTLELAVLAIVIALVDRHPGRHRLGGRPRTRAWDYAANAFALWGLSTPNFWLGIMMILLFSVHARLAAGVGLREPVRGPRAPTSPR